MLHQTKRGPSKIALAVCSPISWGRGPCCACFTAHTEAALRFSSLFLLQPNLQTLALYCIHTPTHVVGYNKRRITSRPQVHSNGFHFHFSLEEDPKLGYVLPTWLGDKPPEPELLTALSSCVLPRLTRRPQHLQHNLQTSRREAAAASGAVASVTPQAELASAEQPAQVVLPQLLSDMTLLHLPLKPGCEDVGQKLGQLRPTLLLFLRQLRCLVLSDVEAGTVRLLVAEVVGGLVSRAVRRLNRQQGDSVAT